MNTINLNLAVVVGEVARPPQTKELKSGSSVVNIDVKVKSEGVPSHTVPVSWMDPPEWVLSLEQGQHVAVVGRVRQQWFGEASRFTDVLAERVVKCNTASGMRKALDSAFAVLEDATP